MIIALECKAKNQEQIDVVTQAVKDIESLCGGNIFFRPPGHDITVFVVRGSDTKETGEVIAYIDTDKIKLLKGQTI